MIILDIKQQTPEWFAARLGKPTASMFSEIVTSTGNKSESWKRALYRLAGERIEGKHSERPQSEAMRLGNEREPMAISLYELHFNKDVERVGFCFMDATKRCGFSPDGLVNDGGGLEVKCPGITKHLKNLETNGIPTEYKCQVYASLYMSGREWWDFMSYHPNAVPVYRRVTRNDTGYKKYSAALDEHLPEFLDNLDDLYNSLISKGFIYKRSA